MASLECGRLSLDLWHDYQWSDCNWANWSLITVEGEMSFYAGTVEVHLALLGVHVRATWLYDLSASNQLRERLSAMMDEIGREKKESDGPDSIRH